MGSLFGLEDSRGRAGPHGPAFVSHRSANAGAQAGGARASPARATARVADSAPREGAIVVPAPSTRTATAAQGGGAAMLAPASRQNGQSCPGAGGAGASLVPCQ